MAEVYGAAAAADGLEEIVTEADMANFIENPIDSDPAHDTLIAEVDGRVVGYAWISHKVEAGGDDGRPATEIHQHRGYVLPEWRRRGLGTAMFGRLSRRAEARRVSIDPTTARVLQSFALDSETGAHALLQRFGYQPIRYAFLMRRDLSQPIPPLPFPDGIEVRPALPEQRRQIWEAEREAFQDHWGYAPWPEGAFQRFLNFPHYDLSLWRVAWDGDQVAGSVLSYINEEENRQQGRRLGYAEDISVRRPWRRRGLASALIASSLEALKARGMTEAALGVDAENRTGALQVYESLGFVVSNQWTVYRRPLPAAG
jgi:mycothiol synthase